LLAGVALTLLFWGFLGFLFSKNPQNPENISNVSSRPMRFFVGEKNPKKNCVEMTDRGGLGLTASVWAGGVAH
jgi:hypothetical protein